MERGSFGRNYRRASFSVFFGFPLFRCSENADELFVSHWLEEDPGEEVGSGVTAKFRVRRQCKDRKSAEA